MSDLAGPKDLAELLSACQPEADYVDFERAWASGNTDQIIKLFDRKYLDILFVGAHTLPNISALKWFLELVLPNIESSADITIVVAGSLEKVRGNFGEYNQLFWAGSVANLEPLYAAAKVVILPIIEGAGINIKVIESIAYGKPIVATEFALRGIPKNLGLNGHNSPIAFADDISSLLSDEKLRTSRSILSRNVCKKINEIYSVNDAMTDTMRKTIGSAALEKLENTKDNIDQIFIEWNEAISSINRMISSFVESGDNLRHDIDMFFLALKDNVNRNHIVKEIFEALFINANSPSLKTKQRRFQVIKAENKWRGTHWTNILREIYIAATVEEINVVSRFLEENLMNKCQNLAVFGDPDNLSCLAKKLFDVFDSGYDANIISEKISLLEYAPIDGLFISMSIKEPIIVIMPNHSGQAFNPGYFILFEAARNLGVTVLISKEFGWFAKHQMPNVFLEDNVESIKIRLKMLAS